MLDGGAGLLTEHIAQAGPLEERSVEN